MIENSTGTRLAALFTFVCIIFLLSAPARAEEIKKGLKLVETKTGLVPELCHEELSEWVILPGTRIKAGLFRYIYGSSFNARHNVEEQDETCKAGLLFDDALYYVDYPDPGGDTNFGVYKDYFLMDSFAYMASHNRTMYLFRYGKESARLLDQIGVAAPAKGVWLDFMSVSILANKPGYKRSFDKSPVWMDIADIDHDGRPELAISIVRGPYWTYYDRKFNLFIEIKDERLRLDLNPALYRPLFEKERKKAKGKRFKPDAYYIYGFLAGEFTLDKVKALLKDELYVAEAKRDFKKHDAEYYDQYESVVPLLESRDKWDYKFHYHGGESKPIDDKPEELIKYEIKRR
ncbi:hypothetical protein EPN18_09965 [bacterium]|nr:MAG: hypothetical protein EPN18_09965 [bacterium]